MIEDLATINKPAFTPKELLLSRVLLLFENIVKVPLFHCRHCGECVLSSTAFVCSQNCPKRLRNGPCGGTRKNGFCEVYPDKKCVWYKIYYRAKFLNRLSTLYKFRKIHNWNLEGTSAWLNVYKKRIEPPVWLIHDKEK